MGKPAGWLFIVSGAIALVVGCVPWFEVWLMPRKPYHYYYVAPEAITRFYALVAVGLVLSLIGLCMLVRPHRPD